ncbi:iron-sulfur cluster biosynthesis family protein, partial [Citrobacter amalonaticus]|uniref:iron-sulfur cluster biosynthesis family protein n=1 Tax=Citrobacter amalonaticus TaxID=35703 RepID=UPI002E76E36A
PGMLGVRLGVKQTGCAGFGYVLDTVSDPEKDDLLFEVEGAKLYVPLQAMPFIDGTEVDYVREGLNQLFKGAAIMAAPPMPSVSVMALSPISGLASA